MREAMAVAVSGPRRRRPVQLGQPWKYGYAAGMCGGGEEKSNFFGRNILTFNFYGSILSSTSLGSYT